MVDKTEGRVRAIFTHLLRVGGWGCYNGQSYNFVGEGSRGKPLDHLMKLIFKGDEDYLLWKPVCGKLI
jgi:hypothetical protein